MSLSPKDALDAVQQHLSKTSPQEFAEEVGQYCTNETGPAKGFASNADAPVEPKSQTVLFHSHPSPLALDAYLASATTGLTDDQHCIVVSLSGLIAKICQSHDIKLYQSRKGGTNSKTDPGVKDSNAFKLDRERVLSSDLLIHLCHFPSTSAGEDLSFAHSSLIPVILIAHNDSRVSQMIAGIASPKIKLSYCTSNDVEHQLDDCLLELRPFLEQRKMAFSEYDVNLVGNKIRMLREELGLTRSDVVRVMPELTVEHLQFVEESHDGLSDPSLMFLRRIATVLKTTVADLVQPDLRA